MIDDWLREGLEDIASEAPLALEVPSTLRRRARGRMTITILTSLAVVVALGVGVVASLRALGSNIDPDVGVPPAPSRSVSRPDEPTKSVSPPVEPSAVPANTVIATLTDDGCTVRSGEIGPGPITFRGESSSASRAVFDIGIIQPGHSFEELEADVQALGTGVVARSFDGIPQLRPPYFEGSLPGREGGHASSDRPLSLFPVTSSTYQYWRPTAAVTPSGTDLAIVCYRYEGSFSDPEFVLAGVLGPFEVR
jgi:hypothetical protein